MDLLVLFLDHIFNHLLSAYVLVCLFRPVYRGFTFRSILFSRLMATFKSSIPWLIVFPPTMSTVPMSLTPSSWAFLPVRIALLTLAIFQAQSVIEGALILFVQAVSSPEFAVLVVSFIVFPQVVY